MYFCTSWRGFQVSRLAASCVSFPFPASVHSHYLVTDSSLCCGDQWSAPGPLRSLRAPGALRYRSAIRGAKFPWREKESAWKAQRQSRSRRRDCWFSPEFRANLNKWRVSLITGRHFGSVAKSYLLIEIVSTLMHVGLVPQTVIFPPFIQMISS